MLGVEQGISGKLGSCLAKFNCFRQRETFVYSVLANDLEKDDNVDDDDDELLFGLDDSNLRGPSEPDVTFDNS